jgi:undecaprenyl-diphosphatase
MLLVAGPGASAVGTTIKLLVHRPRPDAELVHVARPLTGYSFPSGHVVFYTGFFGFLMYLILTLFPPSPWRAALLAVLGALILLVGPSRVVLGGHWPSDVGGGYLLGGLWLLVSIGLYRWGRARIGGPPTGQA